jgi:hypothetical protein
MEWQIMPKGNGENEQKFVPQGTWTLEVPSLAALKEDDLLGAQAKKAFTLTSAIVVICGLKWYAIFTFFLYKNAKFSCTFGARGLNIDLKLGLSKYTLNVSEFC